MDKRHVDDQVEFLERLGVQFQYNTRIGYDITVDGLFAEGYRAVFLGHGAGQGNKLGVPGEDLDGIHMATDFLVRANLPAGELPEWMWDSLEVGKRVAVIGGGDTSMDCVRSAVRMGCEEVCCVYRRTEAEMAGREEERRHAKEEGVRFVFQATPVRFVAAPGENRVQAVRFQRMELGEPDESGRRRPVPVIGSEFDIEAETVIIAIGYKVEKLLHQTTPELDATEWGTVKAAENGRTSRPGVFAAGDNVRGADLVVTALADAKKAAAAMDEYLRNGA
jgi:glutamate synthase (NADPH/NADH) small chain